MIRKLRTGITWINTYHPTYNEAPWGGYKQSGIGRELGTHGFDEYTEVKQINVNLAVEPDRLVRRPGRLGARVFGAAHDKRLMKLRALVLAAIGIAVALLRGPSSAATTPDDVLKATLGNGLRVVIVRDTLAPVVSTDVAYLVGSRDDPADFSGMAHAQEHMMFRGTPTSARASSVRSRRRSGVRSTRRPPTR